MQVLINSYTTTSSGGSLRERSAAGLEYELIEHEDLSASIMFKSTEGSPLKNASIESTLKAIEELENNWDEEGAKAPSENAINQAKAITKLMTAIGEDIYNVAPGPRGEIMLDLRRDAKSLELLFYPDKSKYVTFCPGHKPKQGEFSLTILPDLITWLNC